MNSAESDFARRPEGRSLFGKLVRAKSPLPVKMQAKAREKFPAPVRQSWWKSSQMVAAHFDPSPVCDVRRSRDRDPCAFSRARPADRKCNRAVRFGARPIYDRDRSRRNRRALVACDNNYSRWRHRFDGHARPFPIAVRDKHPSRLPPSADRGDRSANSGQKSDRSTKRRTCRKFREKEEAALSWMHILRFDRIEKCGHGGGATESEEHQDKMICEYEMRNREQNSGDAATA